MRRPTRGRRGASRSATMSACALAGAGGEWAGREGVVTSLSADGCFVMSEGAVAEGELVQVQVELPGGESLPLWGSVVHRVEGEGFAIRFSLFSQGGARERLKALLREA
ncbi:MAG: PilZ domain-containing protein, partial [Pyrinomonadaceae bacterium]